MKVIFLDFDGVLNSNRYVRECGYFGVVLDPRAMEILKDIVDRTDAKLVLSTSWKEHWSKNEKKCDASGTLINEIFARYGLSIYDKTPLLPREREVQIRQWLTDNPETENFAVLDDMFLSADFMTGHFVKTSSFKGLEKEEAEKVIRILEEKN